jgi:putative Mn2+ efflux pump MntP
MFNFEILLLSLALSVDAGVVTFAISLLHERETPSSKFRNALITASTFGVFQFGMLWIGSFAGYLFTFSSVGYYFQLAIGLIFIGLALKCIYESFDESEKKIEWGFIPILFLGLATSLDALVSGLSLGPLPHPYLVSIDVGLTTFSVCSFFYVLGQFFKNIPDRWLLRLAASIFFVLGSQVFWGLRHLFF